MIKKEEINAITEKLKKLPLDQLLLYFIEKYKHKVAFSTSFSIEDQMITDIIDKIISKNNNVKSDDIKIFTLDTGRYFYQTYDLWQKTDDRYKNIKIRTYFPDNQEVQKMIDNYGINLFYDDVKKRKLCCKVRKVNPLEKALKDMEIWITGLRQEQSSTRNNLKLIEWNAKNNILKINPLTHYTEEQVWEYTKKEKVPFNVLYKEGFRSIGCAPCTCKIEPDQDLRAGRWWWENKNSRECGLHIE